MQGRAQGSLEFLLTYGWAILLIGIAAGVVFFLGFNAGNVSFYSMNNVVAVKEGVVSEVGIVNVLAENVSGDALNVTGFSLGKDFADLGEASLNGVARKQVSEDSPVAIQAGGELLFENIVYGGLGPVYGQVIIHTETGDYLIIGSGATVPNAVAITSCEDPIEVGGNYALANDMTSKSGCLKIEQDNVFLNCQGKEIGGEGFGNAVHVNGLKNVTVSNCFANNFETSFWVEDSSDCSLNNNSAEESGQIGFYLKDSSGVEVFDNGSQGHSKGFYLMSSQGNSLWKNVSNGGDYGFVLYGSSNNNSLVSNTALENVFSGLLVFDSSDNIVSESHFCENAEEFGKDIECLGSSKNNSGENNSAGSFSDDCLLENTLPC